MFSKETRGWYRSGGEIDCAGEKDQRDISEVISYTLNRSDWQPDPERLAMVGISYGAGLALLGAVRDVRIKAVVAMSGWTDFQEALFKGGSPSRVWGTLLVLLSHVVGKPERLLDQVYRQMLAGNISGFAEFAQIRSVNLSALEARKLPIFMSNNFEDRVFSPDDALAFLETLSCNIPENSNIHRSLQPHYKGPKRLLLNQGIHASAEIPGLFGLKNHVWAEAKKWLHTYLKGEAYPAPPLLEMQLRSNWATREQFDLWPSARIEYSTLVPSPRASHSKWQIVAYLFGVNRRTKVGTLISHGSVTCWNCTAGVRGTHHITLRSLCEDLGGWGMGGRCPSHDMYPSWHDGYGGKSLGRGGRWGPNQDSWQIDWIDDEHFKLELEEKFINDDGIEDP
eukprot:g22803.t1